LKSISITVLAFFGIISFSTTVAQEHQEWMAIADPAELRELVSGQALDGRYWKFYFRADGKMAYSKNDFISVREWSITDAGKLCYSVFSLPDRIIECHTVERTAELPATYRFKSETEEFVIEFSAPAKDLIDAVTERAGSE
jgi:hypothetical protein